MKRHGNLWQQIISFENLLLSARKAQRGKRYRDNVLAFNDRLEQNLLLLQRHLQDRTYQPGAYRTFEIFEPKPRIISAAPYPDRVVHFVGFRVLGDRIRVRNDNLRRARVRRQRLCSAQRQGHDVAERIERSQQSWLAHLNHGDTWRLQQKILEMP
jgi:hypothetical protein